MSKVDSLSIIVGARPQFIKLAPLYKSLASLFDITIIHTGQHFDSNMSDIFFTQMNIPAPTHSLAISSGTHGEQTGRMLIEIEKKLLESRPDLTVVFGDTNSTLAGALASSKLNIPVLHIESGLRSFDRSMPEEQNRILTDHISTYLACPCENAANNLRKEGITSNVFNTGDLMFDAALHYLDVAKSHSVSKDIDNLLSYIVPRNHFCLLTIHRASNTDNPIVLEALLDTLGQTGIEFIFPIHPRTKKMITQFNIRLPESIHLIDPVGYLEMLLLIDRCEKVVTDSGGLQKEAFFLNKICITLRDTTEWIELLDLGVNFLTFDTPIHLNKPLLIKKLADSVLFPTTFSDSTPYGNANASEKISDLILSF